jgi:hypothetical protein
LRWLDDVEEDLGEIVRRWRNKWMGMSERGDLRRPNSFWDCTVKE